jgi:hypothetical protein
MKPSPRFFKSLGANLCVVFNAPCSALVHTAPRAQHTEHLHASQQLTATVALEGLVEGTSILNAQQPGALSRVHVYVINYDGSYYSNSLLWGGARASK